MGYGFRIHQYTHKTYAYFYMESLDKVYVHASIVAAAVSFTSKPLSNQHNTLECYASILGEYFNVWSLIP